MPKVKVDGVEIEVPAGITVLQACELAGKEIPRFCYHERLSIAGNCRMCLVEVEARAAQAAGELRAARRRQAGDPHRHADGARRRAKGVMEFLLINHPLDCPICDQGGECDLQDQAMAYGSTTAAIDENKRAVDDKYMGPLVKTVDDPLHPVHALHPLRHRGGGRRRSWARPAAARTWRSRPIVEQALYDRAVRQPGRSLPGRRADLEALCLRGAAVGAAQDRSDRRAWTRSAPTSASTRAARRCMRILPRINDDVNEEWIADKTRHAIDGLRCQRLDRP